MKKYKPNEWSAFLQKNATYVGEASVEGKLYRIDFYPGLVKAEGTVYGEVYKLHEPELVLPRLDDYEDFRPDNLDDSLYLRENVEVKMLHNQKKKTSLIYYFNKSVKYYSEITSGRFSPL
ncbi:gamma-glutamylcyclotransferase family protein [Arcticibacterium luteifluviistationis]